mmetsp:Transcript_51714/g.66234  ORF Transcript_51714/g.66234 Transcript_51714/m.66234 type:complete len:121 (+) Transcript_51714:129-491(+)
MDAEDHALCSCHRGLDPAWPAPHEGPARLLAQPGKHHADAVHGMVLHHVAVLDDLGWELRALQTGHENRPDGPGDHRAAALQAAPDAVRLDQCHFHRLLWRQGRCLHRFDRWQLQGLGSG